MVLPEKISLLFKMATDSRFRSDVKALKYASDGYVHYGLETLDELGLLSLLERGVTLEELVEEGGLEHRVMLEHLLDFLVGREVLRFSDGKYTIEKLEDPFDYHELRYLEKKYPYSVEWNNFLVSKAQEALDAGKDFSEAGFSDERFLRVWDNMMDESPYSFKKMMIEKLLSSSGNGDKLLDVGGGTGSLIEMVIQNIDSQLEITATDQSEEALELAKERMGKIETLANSRRMRLNASNVGFMHYDVMEDPLYEEEFDYAMTSLMFNHIPEEEVEEVLKNIRAMLKPGGKLGIYQLVHQSKFDRVPMWVIHAVPTHVGYPYRDEFISKCESVFDNVESSAQGTVIIAEK